MRIWVETLPGPKSTGGVSTRFLGLDMGELHGLAADGRMIVALGRAGMALHHQYIVKNGPLLWMMRAEEPTQMP